MRSAKQSLEDRSVRYELTAAALLAAAVVLPNYLVTTLKVNFPGGAHVAVVVMVTMLVMSTVCSHLVRWPIGYAAAKPDALARLTEEQFWNGEASIGARRTAEALVEEVSSAHDRNQWKAQVLRLAIAFEAAAIAAAGAAALVALTVLN